MHLKSSLLVTLSAVFLAWTNLSFSESTAATAEKLMDEEAKPWWSATLSAEYDSKYVFRGVNSLPGSGIAVVDFKLSAYDFSLDVWQAAGLRKAYDEVDFTFTCAHKFGAVTLSGGYINYYFPDDDGLELGYRDTQELFAAASYEFASSFTASLSYNSDFDKINGSYLELKLVDSIAIVKDKAGLDPYASLSYDFRYNSTTRALNNFQIGLNAPVSLGKHLSVAGFAALSIPLHGIADFAKREGWGGFTVTFAF
ncbi:MAG: hypothetical protein WAN04_11625 [Candidatus Udaeobacter sp.]